MLIHQTGQTDNPSLPFISQTSFRNWPIFVSKPIDKLMTLCYTVDKIEHRDTEGETEMETSKQRAMDSNTKALEALEKFYQEKQISAQIYEHAKATLLKSRELIAASL